MISKFFEGVRWNFQNTLAFFMCVSCLLIWAVIIINDAHADNPHVAEIRTACQTIIVMIMSFYFGASQGSKKKDEVIQDMAATNAKKDEALKSMVQDAKDLVVTNTKEGKDLNVDVTLKTGNDVKDE